MQNTARKTYTTIIIFVVMLLVLRKKTTARQATAWQLLPPSTIVCKICPFYLKKLTKLNLLNILFAYGIFHYVMIVRLNKKITIKSLYTTKNRHVQPTPCDTSVMKVVVQNPVSVPLGKHTRMLSGTYEVDLEPRTMPTGMQGRSQQTREHTTRFTL